MCSKNWKFWKLLAYWKACSEALIQLTYICVIPICVLNFPSLQYVHETFHFSYRLRIFKIWNVLENSDIAFSTTLSETLFKVKATPKEKHITNIHCFLASNYFPINILSLLWFQLINVSVDWFIYLKLSLWILSSYI